jgi:hypothetical protein
VKATPFEPVCCRKPVSHPYEYQTKAKSHSRWLFTFVGVAGFEPATSCSQSRHTNRAVLYPEYSDEKRGTKVLISEKNANGIIRAVSFEL